MRLNGVHLVEVQGQKTGGRDFFQRCIIAFKVNGLRFNKHLFWGRREGQFGPRLVSASGSVSDQCSFNEAVVQRSCEPIRITIRRKAVEHVRCVGCDFCIAVRWEKGEKAVGRCLSRVVGYAWFEAHGDDRFRAIAKGRCGQHRRVRCTKFDDGVGEQVIHAFGNGL